jgi:hypothetical protein
MNAAATKNKPEAPSVPADPTPAEPTIRIIKVGSCPSLSGKSTLTYHIGCDAESAIHFRVFANSSSGYFSREWIAADKIGKALGESNNITSFTLRDIYTGKSCNNGGFLLASLKNEGLVFPSEEEDARNYQLGDPAKFMSEMKALMESQVNLDPDAKPKKPSKKKPASEPSDTPSAE